MKYPRLKLCTSLGRSWPPTSACCCSRAANRLLRFVTPDRRMKCFWACEATWVGVRVDTKYLLMPRQLPLPSFFRPWRKNLCSASVQGWPTVQGGQGEQEASERGRA